MARRETHEGGAGRYAIYGEIASGGMASVHLGRLHGPHGFTRTVAIKRLHPQFAKDADFVTMFLDEAHTAARIRHPNVVATVDVVSNETDLLLVMEYVAGESLARLMKAAGTARAAVPHAVVSAVVVGVLHGLHAAHEAKNEFGEPLGIVHRDVSPQNVLVGADGVARVIDFGIAKAASNLAQTAGASFKGKMAYMSPEQARSLPVTRKTDIFAASIVLWEALTMQRLFASDHDAATIQKVLTMRVPKPSTVAPTVSEEVDAIVLRGLERDPPKRWGTARDMALALEQALPPALPSEVGRWVEEMAKEALANKARSVAEIESSSAGRRDTVDGLVGSSQFIAEYLWPESQAHGRRPSRAPGPRAGGESDAGDDEGNAFEPRSRAGKADPDADAREDAPRLSQRSRRDFPLEDGVEAPVRSAPPASRAPAANVPDAAEPVLEVVRPRPRAAPLPPEPRASWTGPALRYVLGAGVLALAAYGAAAIFLPRYVRDRAVAAADEEGLTLGIEDVSVGVGTVRLIGVTVTSPEVPGMKAVASEVRVDMAGWEPKLATVRTAELTLDGTLTDLAAALERMRAAHAGPAGARVGAGEDRARIVAPVVRVTWTRPIGEGSKLEIEGGVLDVSPHASPRVGDELHFAAQTLTLATAIGTLGPWRVDLDRDPTSTRVRLAFDPPVPDGPNLLYSRGIAEDSHLDINIPRSPLSQLGLSPVTAAVALGAPSHIEATVHYARMPARTEADATVTLVGAHLPQAPGPVDVVVTGSVAGDGRGPLDLKDGSITAGPIKAALWGAVAIGDTMRADLSWKATPVPCTKLVPPSVNKGLSDLSKELGDLGDVKQELADLGLDVSALDGGGGPRVSGTLSATGTLVIDTGDLGRSGITVKSKNNCGISFLGSR